MPDRIDTPRQFIIILGMHRSGTSSLAGSLQQGGLHLGEVHEWNPHNQKGNRESQKIMELNDAVLAFNGAAWDVPPNSPLIWNDQLSVQRDEILQSFRSCDSTAVGFKDPRTLLTLDFWLDAGVGFQFAGTFRHPLSVANSLKVRSGMSLDKGLSLWEAYNKKLLARLSLQPFPVLCFDVEVQGYQKNLVTVMNLLGLSGASGGPGPFFESDLRHHAAPVDLSSVECDQALLMSCLATYKDLYNYYSQALS